MKAGLGRQATSPSGQWDGCIWFLGQDSSEENPRRSSAEEPPTFLRVGVAAVFQLHSSAGNA